ncbi:MAG: NAD(P)/FAD-dependent oxidoreductase [Deltaproteobacteria bacterium]|nr:NAD(P)/FAD-dependent oxidoreductase [Deltaproteobacteria bacterium]
MTNKKTIIIGAGLAGLSAGCYGQMNGYDTQIFEAHHMPGGLCTAWKRKGFTIPTAGWVNGSGPANNDTHRFWNELGAIQGREFADYPEYARIEAKNGQTLILYTDIDRLEEHMLELAPEDSKLIKDFAAGLRVFTRLKIPTDKAPELMGFVDKVKMMAKFLPVMLGPNGKWLKMSLGDFANRFKSPLMREFFSEGVPNVFFFDTDIALMFVMSTLASMHLKNAGYPMGGCMGFVRAIERRYNDLGGQIHYRLPVEEILVENDRAVGVRLADGTEHRADVVISAADGRRTIFDMLHGRYLNDEIKKRYDSMPLFPRLFFISLGVNRTFEKKPASVGGDVFRLDEPIDIAGKKVQWLAPHIYDFDASLAPQDKTLIRVMLPASHEYWAELRKSDRARYNVEKQEIADAVIAGLDKRYPGLAGQVEMCDVATPVTFERYTGNYKGSPLGWLTTAKTMQMSVSKALPGLEGFYLVGTWVLNGSIAYAATSGRHVTQVLCKKDGKPFVTALPPEAVEMQDTARAAGF